MRTPVATLLVSAALAVPTATPAQSLRPALDFATADAIRDHCLAHAARAGHAVAVAVFDQGGDLLSFANDGASPATGAVAQWKGRSAAIYRVSTATTGAWNVPTAPMIATVEGGVPLYTAGGVGIGGVGVSGAPPRFDAECGARAAESVGLAAAPGR